MCNSHYHRQKASLKIPTATRKLTRGTNCVVGIISVHCLFGRFRVPMFSCADATRIPVCFDTLEGRAGFSLFVSRLLHVVESGR